MSSLLVCSSFAAALVLHSLSFLQQQLLLQAAVVNLSSEPKVCALDPCALRGMLEGDLVPPPILYIWFRAQLGCRSWMLFTMRRGCFR